MLLAFCWWIRRVDRPTEPLRRYDELARPADDELARPDVRPRAADVARTPRCSA